VPTANEVRLVCASGPSSSPHASGPLVPVSGTSRAGGLCAFTEAAHFTSPNFSLGLLIEFLIDIEKEHCKMNVSRGHGSFQGIHASGLFLLVY
jgi:hypothetical protein